MESLPNELLLNVLGKLPLEDMLTCHQVSRRLRSLSAEAMSHVHLLVVTVNGGLLSASDPLVTLKTSFGTSMDDYTDEEVEGTSVGFTVNYSLAQKFDHSKRKEMESVLEKMWKSMMRMLRCCDTSSLDIHVMVPDLCGALAKQVEVERELVQKYGRVSVRDLCLIPGKASSISMESLPNELLLDILGRLPLEDMLRCHQVSRRLRSLSAKTMSNVRLLGISVYSLEDSPKGESDQLCTLTTEFRTGSFYVVERDAGEDVFGHNVKHRCEFFSVNYSLAKKYGHAKMHEMERVLGNMWKTMMTMLRCCDTRFTRLDVRVSDLCGALAKQLEIERELVQNYGHISVGRLTLWLETYNLLDVVRSKNFNGFGDLPDKRDVKIDEALLPNHTWSSLLGFEMVLSGPVVRGSTYSTGKDDEPKWTDAMLLKLIKQWQYNGREIDSLVFRGYEYERQEGEFDDRLLFYKTCSALPNVVYLEEDEYDDEEYEEEEEEEGVDREDQPEFLYYRRDVPRDYSLGWETDYNLYLSIEHRETKKCIKVCCVFLLKDEDGGRESYRLRDVYIERRGVRYGVFE